MAKIVAIKIHPAIGIARLGNSPAEFFTGPEKPGPPRRPRGGYKDAQGRIKRQAARFRLFAFDHDGNLVQEITARDAVITWTVHLANAKAAWVKFQGPKSKTKPALKRNNTVIDRKSLIIDPGPRSLNGPNQAASFSTGAFLGTRVPLGDIRTDKQGRLLVLGGFGRSGSPRQVPLDENEFANNDGWFDDVSDGPVTATVQLKRGGATLQAVSAWVICAAPKFVPAINNVITLHDVLLQVAVDQLGLRPPAKPSFTSDIYPLLQRAINMRWVSGMVAHPMAHSDQHSPQHEAHHGFNPGPAHATLSAVIPPPGLAAARAAIFK